VCHFATSSESPNQNLFTAKGAKVRKESQNRKDMYADGVVAIKLALEVRL